MLARVVRAAEGRVVAVIGGDDADVARAEKRGDLRDPGVEGLERRRIAGDVALMPELGVEIDEIGEDEPASRQAAKGLERERQHGHVAGGLALSAGRAMREDVADLADAHDGAAGLLQAVEQGRAGGGVAKSLRFAVRVKPDAASPTKGRAMTRPMR